MVIYSMRMYIHKRPPMDRVGWANIQMLRYVLRSGLQSRCNGSGGRGLRPTSFISRLIKPIAGGRGSVDGTCQADVRPVL